MLRAQSPTKAPQLIGSSAVTGMAVTGTTNETALATISIPAGAMGLHGGLMIYATWSVTNSANNKTIRTRLGGIAGTIFSTLTLTTSGSQQTFTRIRNRGSASSQVGGITASLSNMFSPSTGATTTGTVDTSVAVDLVFSGQLASAAETITLESYEVWLLPAA